MALPSNFSVPESSLLTVADYELLLNLKGKACTDIKREVQVGLGVLTGVIIDGLDTVFHPQRIVPEVLILENLHNP